MSFFYKSDLQYTDYKWTAYPHDDPKITGKPDSTRFNRHEGYEMLYLINKLAELWGSGQITFCRKMEWLIREKLPSNMVMQSEVRDWLFNQR